MIAKYNNNTYIANLKDEHALANLKAGLPKK